MFFDSVKSLIFQIFVLLLVLVQLSCSYADNELLELAFCPSDKPYSFANKKLCCELRVNLFQPLEDQECDGNETACEFEDGCEDCKYLFQTTVHSK